jgi:acyl-coenzyme A thioesterase PaaI-like protein
MLEKLSLTQTDDQLRAYLETFSALPLAKRFGAKVELADPYRLRSVMTIQEEHRGGLQSSAVNGGVMAAIFDLMLGMPALLRGLPDRHVATVQLSISFMKALKGDVINAGSWITRAGGGLVFTYAELHDGNGELCASASGVARMLEGYSEARKY